MIPAAADGVRSRWGRAALFAALAAVYLALPLDLVFSDGESFADWIRAHGPRPHYNVAYVPLAWAFHTVFGAVSGSLEASMTALSALACAAAVTTAHGLFRRMGAARYVAWAWTAMTAAAPAVLLHAGLFEVHGVQMLGAVVALRLAFEARHRDPRPAALLLLGAGVIAMLSHLSHILLLPGLLLVAHRRAGASGVRIDRPVVVLTLIAAVPTIAAVQWLRTTEAARISEGRESWQWAFMLVQYHDQWMSALAAHGWRSAADIATYLGYELVRGAGVIIVAPLAVLVAWPWLADLRRFALRLAATTIPALVVLPQGGVYERGGYFVSYLVVFAALGVVGTQRLAERFPHRRRAMASILVVLVVAQLALAPSERRRFVESGPDAREWAMRVEGIVAPGDKVLVAGMEKTVALQKRAPEVLAVDIARAIDLVPDRKRTRTATLAMVNALTRRDFDGATYLDDAALHLPRTRGTFADVLAHPAVRIARVEGLPDGYGLWRLSVVPRVPRDD